MSVPYRRVLLKLSGESFGGGKLGVDPIIVRSVARQIAAVVAKGAQVSVVVGAAPTSAVPNCSAAAWTATAPTTWACWAP